MLPCAATHHPTPPGPPTPRAAPAPCCRTFRVTYSYSGNITGAVFVAPCVHTHSNVMGNRVVFLVVSGLCVPQVYRTRDIMLYSHGRLTLK